MISVCIATYNGAKYIEQQLSTILSQLGEYDEVIVSDDGSIDDTLDIIRSFNDRRVKIVFHNKTPRKFPLDYAASNFENAMREAQGDIIFLSDQDDIWLPNKVKSVMESIVENDIVLHDCNIIDKSGNEIFPSFFALRKPQFNPIKIFIKPSHLGCCMAFKRKVMEDALPIPVPGVGHDQWIALRASRRFRYKLIPEVLVSYRKHDNCVTPLKSTNSLWAKLCYRLYVFRAIISRGI
ncbi:MAG: glycosyltransferase [Muribaculum sp.]|nr:glycosyltransferase [Muribaculum sp.]